MSYMRSVCVFCGSSGGVSAEQLDLAAETGAEIARRGLRLVYGGSADGSMGRLADAALAAGGAVIGIVPIELARRSERDVHDRLTKLVTVASLAERKEEMVARSDAFISLPGGLGTLDELFEVLALTTIGALGGRPIGLLNPSGYYDPLLEFLDRCVEGGFVRREHREALVVDETPDALLDRLGAQS